MALGHLEQNAALPIEDEEVRIDRSLTDPLAALAAQGSVLLVGAPGSGKSGALHQLATDASANERDTVVLAADTLAVSDIPELNEKIGLTHDIVDVLENWPGAGPGFLVIDALDAARGSEGPEGFIDLIERVSRSQSRWRVVASIRTFDLRHNPRLRSALATSGSSSGTVTALADPEFAEVRHLAVPPLRDEELGQLRQRAPDLHFFLESATPGLRDLVRNPFNLRLLVQLRRSGTTPERLHGVTSQIELSACTGTSESRLLQLAGSLANGLAPRLCEAAIEHLRLQVPRDDIVGLPDAEPALTELLREGVVVELREQDLARRERLAFAHHVLFDYATARLIFGAIRRRSVVAFASTTIWCFWRGQSS